MKFVYLFLSNTFVMHICILFSVHRLFTCASSYVSSNRLPEWMHSHIGCICLTFLQCEFSCVSSNDLPEMIHSHTGCICWTFLQCVFSCVSSNDLPEMMHSHNGCICWTFSSVCFHVSPQFICLR